MKSTQQATENPTVHPNELTGLYISCIMSAGLSRPRTWDEGIPDYLSNENWLTANIPTSYTKQVFSDRKIDANFTSTTAPPIVTGKQNNLL